MSIVRTKTFELAVYAKGDEDAAKLALILPGRLDTKDYKHMTDIVDRMAAEGYYAVSFDPPGTWESPGSIDLYTTDNYLKAIQELIDYFGNRPTVAIGHSRGGSMALLAAVKFDEVTSAVAIMSHYGPVGSPKPESINIGYETSLRDLPPGTERTEEKEEFKLPLSYFDNGDVFDPNDLKTCTKPKLFFWGNQDQILSRDSVMQGYDASAEPKKLIELNCEHDYRLHAEIIEEVWQNIREFMADQL